MPPSEAVSAFATVSMTLATVGLVEFGVILGFALRRRAPGAGHELKSGLWIATCLSLLGNGLMISASLIAFATLFGGTYTATEAVIPAFVVFGLGAATLFASMAIAAFSVFRWGPSPMEFG